MCGVSKRKWASCQNSVAERRWIRDSLLQNHQGAASGGAELGSQAGRYDPKKELWRKRELYPETGTRRACWRPWSVAARFLSCLSELVQGNRRRDMCKGPSQKSAGHGWLLVAVLDADGLHFSARLPGASAMWLRPRCRTRHVGRAELLLKQPPSRKTVMCCRPELRKSRASTGSILSADFGEQSEENDHSGTG